MKNNISIDKMLENIIEEFIKIIDTLNDMQKMLEEILADKETNEGR